MSASLFTKVSLLEGQGNYIGGESEERLSVCVGTLWMDVSSELWSLASPPSVRGKYSIID